MSEGERIDSILQDYVNYLRTQRGQCPEQERLVAFQKGTLADELVGKVKAHVDLCGLCRKELRLLEKFERWEEAVEIEEPPDWPEIERRGRERFYAFLNHPKVSAPEKRAFWEGLWRVVRHPGFAFGEGLWRVVRHPAFAYLLLAAVAYPAYRGLFRKPEVVKEVVPEKQIVEVEKPLEITSLRAFELRSTERAASRGPSIVRLSPDEKFFAISFFVPISERPAFVYDVEIYDSQGRRVAEEKAAQPQDWLGNFLLVCRRDLFSPGEYELRVREVNKSTQAVRREFSFPFMVSEK